MTKKGFVGDYEERCRILHLDGVCRGANGKDGSRGTGGKKGGCEEESQTKGIL